MPLTRDRIGDIHEQLLGQQKVPVAAGAHIHIGALVSYDAAGFCVPALDDGSQTGKAVHYAIDGANNQSGANGDKQVTVMTIGVALVDKGTIVPADRGKAAHAATDDTLALTSTNDRPIGTIIAVRNRLVAVQIG